MPLFAEERDHVRQNSDGSLDFIATSEEDEGYYTCRAVNGIGAPAKRTVKVTINILPRILTQSHQIIIHAGNNVTLPCDAVARPVPGAYGVGCSRG
jgi:hypothetical protein